MPMDEFIAEFCRCNRVSIDEINAKKKNYATDSYINYKKLHISLCKFALYFFLVNRYCITYEAAAKLINPEKPVRKPTAFYYILNAERSIIDANPKFIAIFKNTIKELIKYANTRNQRQNA